MTLYHPMFFTATILEWKKLLKPSKYKDIIIESMRFMVKANRVKIYSFAIMDNHIHIIWHIQSGYTKNKIQMSFLKYIAQQIKFDLVQNHPEVLEKFYVGAKDRDYQFWERNALSIELSNDEIFVQKMDYIHNNPVNAGLCQFPSDYKYSSAKFYENKEIEFDFLTHYLD